MKLILDETGLKESLYPFTQTKPAADIRIGIMTIREKWEFIFGIKLNHTISGAEVKDKDVLLIPANRIPLFAESSSFPPSLIVKNTVAIEYPWDIFHLNDQALRNDFILLTKGRRSAAVPASNSVIGNGDLFLEEGASIEHSIINTTTGPVYLGKNSTVMEGSTIRGPFALGEGSVVKMGARIYGATTIGPHCTVGGEIKNSVLSGFSNKAHDGYLGDSVIGEWCNLGAGTSNSNLKNTAGEVKVWNNKTKSWHAAGNKCGLIMGDYCRAAINTSFNTGTITGVCCNIFGENFPPKFIEDFSWGDERYTFEKVLTDIDNWKKLKGKSLTTSEQKILSDIYYSTEKNKDA